MKIYTKHAPKVFGPYSQAIKINKLLMISGQIPVDSISKSIPNNIIDQTLLVLNHIKSIIKISNFSVKDIIKTTIFNKLIRHFDSNLSKINPVA